MKKFLSRGFLLFLILWILAIIVNNLLPYYYGNPLFAKKISFFKQNSTNYNSVCFGTSRVYRHIDPNLISKGLEGISMFNLGTPGDIHAENYYLYENFLNSIDSGVIKLAILEITELDTIANRNRGTLRSIYSNDNIAYILRYISESNFDKNKRFKAFRQYTAGYILRQSSFSKVLKGKKNSSPLEGKDGYFSLDQAINGSGGRDYQHRKRAFLRDSTAIIDHLFKSASYTNDPSALPSVNKTHLKRLKYLLEKSKKKGIKLFFLISPRLESYENLLAIEKEIPDQTINLASPSTFPYFYSTAYSFDKSHLNTAGAEKLTLELVKAITVKLN